MFVLSRRFFLYLLLVRKLGMTFTQSIVLLPSASSPTPFHHLLNTTTRRKLHAPTMESDSPVKMDITSTPTSPPSPPLTLASIEQHPTNMAPRNSSLATDPSSIVVKWHGVSSICTSRWCMLPDRWNTVNKGHEADLKAMIADAFAFRKVVDEPSSYADEPTQTRAAADALRALLMNPLLHTLHSNIFKKVAKSPMRTKVRDWQDKRHSELSESTCHPPSYLTRSQKPGHGMRSRLICHHS